MKTEAKLIDLAIAATYAKKRKTVPESFRDKLIRAQKFVLDEAMSAHMADLTCAPFLSEDRLFVYQVADGARRMARLPYPVTWIEYDCRARKIRTETEYKDIQYLGGTSSGCGLPPEDCIPRVGWLLEEHPTTPCAFKMTEFSDVDGLGVVMPMSYTWVSDDNAVLPWRNLNFSQNGKSPSEIASGIVGYVNDYVGITAGDFFKAATPKLVQAMMLETVGELRAAWTLLATLNDLPVVFDEVRPSRGQMVRGNYRKFVQHSVVKLTVPGNRSLRTMAVRALIAVHRIAHEVRGHWRNDWRHPRTPGCEHEWINFNDHTLACRHCSGRRVWIARTNAAMPAKGLRFTVIPWKGQRHEIASGKR